MAYITFTCTRNDCTITAASWDIIREVCRQRRALQERLKIKWNQELGERIEMTECLTCEEGKTLDI
ncbi:MAG: hypothetical protein AUK24_05580 [Syntrophaceae bacterium CG2_30_49_12]|nr:MAG: hypothetical protein AUK24_05580 [Syntrophaceae bacterium CG2_30_49_12]